MAERDALNPDALPYLVQAMDGIVHFSDAVAFRQDPLSVALREWINAGQAALSKARGENANAA